MNFIILISLLTINAYAASSIIKFTAKTDGPGISVEGEVKNAVVNIDFNKILLTTFSADILDLNTGMEKRDKHMYEKVFLTKEAGISKIDFKLINYNCIGPILETRDCSFVGNLKIKDITNEVKFNAKLNTKNLTAEGKTSISLAKYKLTAPSFMGITVQDDIEIEFIVNGK